jgi:hypothetical protein
MGKTIITVTCDRDGLDYPLNGQYNPEGNPHFRFDRGMRAVQYFNRVFDDRIPITHFICPVYFTRSKFLAEYYTGSISQLIKESHCEIGLHIHGWISLMEACGVAPRDPVNDQSIPDWGAQRQVENSYLANSLFLSAYPNGINIYGRSNDISAAQPQKIQKLLELPDTAILADYVEADYMQEQIDHAVAIASKQSSDVHVSLGFHLESGGDPRFGARFGHIERVIEALEYIDQQYAAAERIRHLTIAEAGKRFLQCVIGQ